MSSEETPKIIALDYKYEENFREFMKVVNQKSSSDTKGNYEKFIKELDMIPYYRGISIREDQRDQLNEFYKKFFVVGEKGNYARSNSMGPVYYDLEYKEIKDSDLREIIIEFNDIIKEKERKIDFYKLKDYMNTHKFNNKKMYIMMINILHNIGNKWGDKKNSPIVSVSRGEKGFETALSFSKGRKQKNNKEKCFIIWGYLKESDKGKYFLTDDINNFLKDLNIEWYPNIHTEILLKDCIYPQNIFGVYEVNENSKEVSLVINPYLYAMFEEVSQLETPNYKKIISEIDMKGIPINQDDFKEYAKSLGYKNYFIDWGEENDVLLNLEESSEARLVPNSYYEH